MPGVLLVVAKFAHLVVQAHNMPTICLRMIHKKIRDLFLSLYHMICF